MQFGISKNLIQWVLKKSVLLVEITKLLVWQTAHLRKPF